MSRPPRRTVAGIAGVLLVVAGVVALVAGGKKGNDAGRVYPQWRGAVTHVFLGQTPKDSVRELTLLHSAGATMTRTEVRQALLEPRKGQFDKKNIGRLDAFFDEAQREQVKVLASLGGTPCWLSSAPSSVLKGCANPIPAGNYPPKDWAGWERIIRWQVSRWGKQMAAVSIENEPNNPGFFKGSPADYAQMVIHAYKAVKSVDPNLPVIAGPLAFSDVNYLEQLYKAGIQGHFDAVGIHPYQVVFDTGTGRISGYSDPLETLFPGEHDFTTGVPAVHEAMVKHGDGDKPLYLDEFGYPTCPGKLCVRDDAQARWISSAMRKAATWPYVKAFLVYQLRDSPESKTTAGGYGLLHTDYSPKPSWAAFKQEIAALPEYPRQ